eukprot:5272586-Lingulodinium_polyedra.AAC.1
MLGQLLLLSAGPVPAIELQLSAGPVPAIEFWKRCCYEVRDQLLQVSAGVKDHLLECGISCWSAGSAAASQCKQLLLLSVLQVSAAFNVLELLQVSASSLRRGACA